MNDYARIEAVIRRLDERHTEQPSLAELAAAVGLSAAHFHRLFHRWAGVTPKDFLQCLTAAHARELLRESASVLDASLAAGLSGPGRLHDLLVTVEAASPGEVKSGGAGLAIQWGRAASPFGPCSVGWTARGICHLAFEEGESADGEVPADLRAAWPRASFQRNETGARQRAEAIFHGGGSGDGETLAAYVRATPFQLLVWRALLRIPEGAVASYGQIAQAVGRPGAARAVGTVCGANAVGVLIPCHRVIRETGAVTGYRWGTARKRVLLAWEGSRGKL